MLRSLLRLKLAIGLPDSFNKQLVGVAFAVAETGVSITPFSAEPRYLFNPLPVARAHIPVSTLARGFVGRDISNHVSYCIR